MSENQPKTYLFTLRLWAEHQAEGQEVWRGKLQLLPDGEASYFRGWSGLVEQIEVLLKSNGYEGDQFYIEGE